MMQCWWMHFPLCPWGWRQGVAPATMLHIAGIWRGNHPFVIISIVDVAIAIAIAITVVITVSIAVTVNVALAYCRCHCRRRWPLLLQSPFPITAAVSFALPSAIAVAVVLPVGHCRLHHRWPSQLPSPLAITVIVAVAHCQELLPCVARIVFKHFKQIMLTLFYFFWTVGGALIKARWLTRHWAAMANTSIGQQAASSERLMGEAAGSRGAVGWRHCLTMGGVVLLGCWVACHWQMAFVMMCWMQ